MYYALQQSPPEKPKFVKVKGRKVKFEGFEEFDFFYYKTDVFAYCILEARSGMSTGTSGTLKRAKELALENLQSCGVSKLKEIITDQIQGHGISPHYKEENHEK